MTERSRVWDGTSVGDATEAPYDAATEFSQILMSIAGAAGVATYLSGVFRNELNQLAVTGAATPVSIATGRSLTWGTWYENDAVTQIAIPTPSASTRIDRIVLRKSWASQTIRLTRIAGVEGGGAPALTTSAGTTWDQPVAQISITTGGVITVTDQRSFIGGSNFSNLSTFATGDLLYAANATTLARLPAGATNSILTITAGIPAWTLTPTLTSLTTTGVVDSAGAIRVTTNNVGHQVREVAGTYRNGIKMNGSNQVEIGDANNTLNLVGPTVFFQSGVSLSFNAGDVQINHTPNTLSFTGASSGYSFDSHIILTAGRISIGTSTFVAGGGLIYKTAVNGLILVGSTGSATDFWLTRPDGQLILDVPTGTLNTRFYGNLTVTTGGAQISAGNLGIGVAPSASVGLQINGAILSGSTQQYSAIIDATMGVGATSEGTAVFGRVRTAATAIVGAGFTFYAATPVLGGSGATIGTQSGIRIASQGATGITNAYGAFIMSQSGASATNFGVYIEAPVGGSAVGLYNLGTTQLNDNMGLGTAPVDATTFYLSGSLMTGVSQFGIRNEVLFGSDALTSGSVYRGRLLTTNFAYTMTDGYTYIASNPALGAGSTVTRLYGFYSGNMGVSGQVGEAYGIYIENQANASSVNIGIFNAGTSQLNGQVGIGGVIFASSKLIVRGNQTASGTTAIGIYDFTTKVAAANNDTLVGIRADMNTTPGAFTGLVLRGMSISGFSTAAFTSPGNPIGLLVGTVTGTGAATGVGIQIDAPIGATINIGLYNAGTSHLVGAVGIGAVAPGAAPTTALLLPAGVAGVSSLRIPHGVAPTSPVNGDCWTTTAGLYIRINGVTVGPLS